MQDATAKMLPPTESEIQAARIYLREELAKSELCPEEKMVDAAIVFKDARNRLNAKL